MVFPTASTVPWILLLVLIPSSGAVNICPTRPVNAQGSGTIESPGHPKKYNKYHECILTLTLPALSTVMFSAKDKYDVHSIKNGLCAKRQYLYLTLPDGTNRSLCGTRTDGQLLSQFTTGEQSARSKFYFKSIWASRGHIFQIAYAVTPLFTTTTAQPSTTSQLLSKATTTTLKRVTTTATPLTSNRVSYSTAVSLVAVVVAVIVAKRRHFWRKESPASNDYRMPNTEYAAVNPGYDSGLNESSQSVAVPSTDTSDYILAGPCKTATKGLDEESPSAVENSDYILAESCDSTIDTRGTDGDYESATEPPIATSESILPEAVESSAVKRTRMIGSQSDVAEYANIDAIQRAEVENNITEIYTAIIRTPHPELKVELIENDLYGS